MQVFLIHEDDLFHIDILTLQHQHLSESHAKPPTAPRRELRHLDRSPLTAHIGLGRE